MDIQANAIVGSLPVNSVSQAERQIFSSGGTAARATGQTTEALIPEAVNAVDTKVDNAQVKDAVNKVNEMVGGLARGLEFSVDDETNIRVVKVVDTESKEVIRQIPSEEILHIAEALDKLQGLLLRDKA